MVSASISFQAFTFPHRAGGLRRAAAHSDHTLKARARARPGRRPLMRDVIAPRIQLTHRVGSTPRVAASKHPPLPYLLASMLGSK
jgi:hypothetical protein